jgi:hypothetical protein
LFLKTNIQFSVSLTTVLKLPITTVGYMLRYKCSVELPTRPTLGPTQPPVQWALEVLSPGLKCGRGVTLTTPI